MLDKEHANFVIHHPQAAEGLVIPRIRFVLPRGNVGAQIKFTSHIGFEPQRHTLLAVLSEGHRFFRHHFTIKRK